MNRPSFLHCTAPGRAAARIAAAAVVAAAAFVAAVAVVAVGLPGPAGATCVCFPIGPQPGFPDPIIQNAGQLNLVVREEGTVRLVPNIRVQGDAESFSLVVPTPSLPQLDPADSDIWLEAGNLTRTVFRRRGSDGDGVFGCDNRLSAEESADGGFSSASEDGVTVVSTQTVGDFTATIISSTSADSLVVWLEGNGYAITPEDADLFDPLVTDGWFFTAMKLADSVAAPNGGWNTNVEPVSFTFDADEFEMPIDILSINRAPWVPITVYAVDDDRMALEGFDTLYANRITAREYSAITEEAPAMAAYLAEGRVLTRLSRVFRDPDEFSGRITLVRNRDQTEFRTIVRGNAPGGPGDGSPRHPRYPGELLLLAAPFVWFKLRPPHRRTRSGRPVRPHRPTRSRRPR